MSIPEGNHEINKLEIFEWIKSNDCVKESLQLTEEELNQQDDLTNSTPLHFAVELDRIKWMRWLLKQPDTNVNARDGAGRTPLHVACLRGCYELVEALIAYGADPNTVDNAQETPLLSAARTEGATPVLKLLLGVKNVEVHARNAQRQTVLHVALIGECQESVQVLLDDTATAVYLNAADADGRTPLHWAYLLGMQDMVMLLQDRGASEVARDNYGNTPLQLFG